MAIIQPPKQTFSWTPILEAMNIGEEIEAPVRFSKTIRERISGKIKDKFPDRLYETDSKSKPGILIIRRIEQ